MPEAKVTDNGPDTFEEATPVETDEESEPREPKVELTNEDMFNIVGSMSKFCGNEKPWEYDPKTFIHHVIWKNDGPIIGLLEKHDVIIPQEDIWFTHCLF